mgnify:CR=1 FL=1
MNLHNNPEEFSQLIAVTADALGIPENAVRRDYYIIMLLQNLQRSSYADNCVFKGGTSLSKCYPGTINRFSEDIDITFVASEQLTDKQYSKILKKIEASISDGFSLDKISGERNDRNKSAYVWHETEDKSECRIKLEIGSSVRPDPYSKRTVKTYIQEYLEEREMIDFASEYELESVYENLHKDLLYTSEKQDFAKAIKAFETISNRLYEIVE